MTAVAPTIEVTIRHYEELTRHAMGPYLRDGHPREYLYELVRDYPQRIGKGLRPALLLATCQAFGGTIRLGLKPAVALEMLHNAFLIHDDVEDGAARRHGRPALHRVHGAALAVNAGDALANMALEPLQHSYLGPWLSQLLIGEFATIVREATEGQALDLGWQRDNIVDLSTTDYLTMAGKKTAWYTTVAPLRMGAIVATQGKARLRELSRFGLYIGLAFQIRDDLLDLDDQSEHGKDVCLDIREGKRTLMLIHLLSSANESDRNWLLDYLRRPQMERSRDADEGVVTLMETYGSIDFARNCALGIADAAYGAFETAFADVPVSEHVDFIRMLIPYMLDRFA